MLYRGRWATDSYGVGSRGGGELRGLRLSVRACARTTAEAMLLSEGASSEFFV
jgi:hypothetical protein